MDQVKENFSINGEQAESVIRQLETIGVLGSKNEDGTHTVMMELLFTPMSITPLIGMEDARFVLNVSRPSP